MSKLDDGPIGRDPRQHIQVIAGMAIGGRTIEYVHEDGSKTNITPSLARRITDYLYDLKPVERQRAVNLMHESHKGIKCH